MKHINFNIGDIIELEDGRKGKYDGNNIWDSQLFYLVINGKRECISVYEIKESSIQEYCR